MIRFPKKVTDHFPRLEGESDKDYIMRASFAAEEKQMPKEMINYSGEVEEYTYSIFYAACESGLIEAVARFIKARADVNECDSTGSILQKLCSIRADKDMVELLIENGAVVNFQNSYGTTALHLAKTTDIAQLLIDNGADVNLRTVDGMTPLHIGLFNKEPLPFDFFKLLIDSGAEVDILDKNGNPPLRYALLKREYTDVAELLINSGTDVNIRNKKGETLLHFAAKNNLTAAANLLIAHGAHINAKNYEELTPSEIAETKGYTDLVRLLTDYGTQNNVGNHHAENEDMDHLLGAELNLNDING